MRRGDIVTIVSEYYRFCEPGQLAVVVEVHHRKGMLAGMVKVVIGAIEGRDTDVYIIVNREDLEVIGHYDYPFIVDPNSGAVMWDAPAALPTTEDREVEEAHWKALQEADK